VFSGWWASRKILRNDMKRWLLGIGIGVASLLGVLLIAVGVLALLPAGTRAIRGEESIAEVRSIELGGFPQTVLLRGNDRRNPVLLYVHGGPGGGQLPSAWPGSPFTWRKQ
jgi:hypothetical protein